MLSVSMLSNVQAMAAVTLEARSFRVSRCSVCREVLRHSTIRTCGCRAAFVEDGVELTIYTDRKSNDWTGFQAVIVASFWEYDSDRDPYLDALARVQVKELERKARGDGGR